jgi:hypothetical protein
MEDLFCLRLEGSACRTANGEDLTRTILIFNDFRSFYVDIILFDGK